MKFDKKSTKKAKNCRFSQKKVLEKYREVLERSLKSPGILFLKKCGNYVDPIGFSDMPDLVVWSEITLDIALWVKSKMTAICPRSNNKLILFLTCNRDRFIFLMSIICF